VAGTRKSKRGPRGPKLGSEAWYAEQQAKPGFALGVMKDLSNDIAQGSKTAIATLEKWIAKYPEVARSVHRFDDLCTMAEAAWVKALAGEDPLRQLRLRDEIAEMKAELQGASPSVLDRVMVSSVVTAHVAHQAAVHAAALPARTSRSRRPGTSGSRAPPGGSWRRSRGSRSSGSSRPAGWPRGRSSRCSRSPREGTGERSGSPGRVFTR
jgi:hypothetical protein